MMSKIYFIGFLLVALSGCQTTASLKEKKYSQETKESLTSVAESLSGKAISEEQLKAVYRDPESLSVLESVKESFETKKRMKYSPRTGKRYAPSMEICPETGVALEWLEE